MNPLPIVSKNNSNSNKSSGSIDGVISQPPSNQRIPPQQPRLSSESAWVGETGTPRAKRPYVNVDEVLRIGSILERKINLSPAQRQEFNWLAFNRSKDTQTNPEFFTHIQIAIGGVCLSTSLVIKTVNFLSTKGMINNSELDMITLKIRAFPENSITFHSLGQLLRSDVEIFKRAPTFIN